MLSLRKESEVVMKPTIIIDAGHGGFDNGASFGDRLEKNDNLKLALAVGEQLNQDGYPVFFTRTEDIYQQPVTKAQIANASGGDYAISFHRNAAASPNLYNGVQTLVYNKNSKAGELADIVNNKMVSAGFKDLGVEERPNLAFLRRTNMPAILIEAGFIDSDKDNALFDQNFNQLVAAITSGIEEAVGGNDSVDMPEPKPGPKYGVQVGLYRRFDNARYQYLNLISQGYDAQIIERDPYFAVVVGEYNAIDDAKNMETQLRKEGYDTLIVTI